MLVTTKVARSTLEISLSLWERVAGRENAQDAFGKRISIGLDTRR
jgi:hypothetical protein